MRRRRDDPDRPTGGEMRSASSGGLELSVERRSTSDGEIAVVRAQGEVDLGNADELAGALGSSACVESDGVVIDLLGVPFMDSSGLRVVLVAAADLEPDLAVVLSPGSPVLRLFELAEVTDRLPVYATADEAIDALADRASD
jgi:stage II sporulation protein AA (anti-sigma F factor antagonist)